MKRRATTRSRVVLAVGAGLIAGCLLTTTSQAQAPGQGTSSPVPSPAPSPTQTGQAANAAPASSAAPTQSPAPAPAPSAEFEVASVKLNKGGDNRVMMGMQPGGRFTGTNVSLRQLMTLAYRVQPFQIVNTPGWADSDRFDIAAKGNGNPTPDDMQSMLRGLLADRFGMVAHTETREMPVYALTLARGDGRLGPKLKESTTDCQALLGRGRVGGPPSTPPPTAPPSNGSIPCGMRIGPGSVTAGGMALTQLATAIAPMTGRVIQDRTGLTARYDLELSWTPDQGMGPGGPLRDGPAPPSSDGGGSLFTAIQEQLGLKLESTRGPVSVVVIDNVSQPTPD